MNIRRRQQMESDGQHSGKARTCEAQEAREWKEQFVEKKESARSARRREEEGKVWCLTWRQVAHTSRPPTQEPRLRRSWRMDLRKEQQEEEAMVSSE